MKFAFVFAILFACVVAASVSSKCVVKIAESSEEFELARTCVKSNANVTAAKMVKNLEECRSFAKSYAGLAFNYYDKNEYTGMVNNEGIENDFLGSGTNGASEFQRRERGQDLECDDNSEQSDPVPLRRIEGNNSCVICDASFRYENDFVYHCLETHGNRYPYSCPHCDGKFKWKRNLKQHVDEKHDAEANPFSLWNSPEITCEICGETKRNWRSFEHHALSKHGNERMMACSHCPKKYTRRSALLAHVKMKHVGGGGVERKFIRERDFQRTKQRERKLPEEQIGNIKVKIENKNDQTVNLKFPGEGMTISATNQGREQNQNDSLNHKAVMKGRWGKITRIYACPHCNLDISGLVEYENHGKSMHKDFPLYNCEECRKGFFHRNTFKLHCKEKHDNDKVRCSHCSKCYNNLGVLWIHERSCERKARNAAMRKEQGLPSYTCDICKKEFYMERKSFMRHVNRHKKYVYCHICKQGFNKFRNSEKLALKEHIRVRHPLLENIDVLLQMAAKAKVKCENVSDRI